MSCSTTTAKTKLRTVADVLFRLRWSEETSPDTIILGYDDRIHGPMEKSFQDYKPIKDGGDIPEHRIWYVRTSLPASTSNTLPTERIDDCVLWDRIGRVDRVFGSGQGADCPVCQETIHHVSSAIEIMARLDLEKQERRAVKEQQRAMKAKKRAAKAAAINYLASNTTTNTTDTKPKRALRYKWVATPWYSYSQESNEWQEGSRNQSPSDASSKTSRKLTVATWNVLFDLYDDELKDHEERWALIGRILERQNVDVIALQEATPAVVNILLSQSWVKKHYACTASPSNTETITTSGNLLLWKKSLLAPVDDEVLVCVDSFRQCSIMASLERIEKEPKSPVFLVTNVHLLANKAAQSDQSIVSRALARQRELASVIGQLQKVEQQLIQKGRIAQPLIVGDFNTSEQDSNYLTSAFADVWPMVAKEGDPGFTFDPTSNVRAARTQSLTNYSGVAKRLDRMYLARRQTQSSFDDELLLSPTKAALVGFEDSTLGEAPPSDHYGLTVSFEIRQKNLDNKIPRPCLRYPDHNAWAANANPTPNTLLALVLDESHLLGPDLKNATSTLPLPHITLLHGFVELSCSGFKELAIQAVRDAINVSAVTCKERALRFTESSLDVFEHRASATLVARPDTQHASMNWLMQLYKALTRTFQQCHEQESRFSEGWMPHVSLGTFGTAFAARTEATKRRWIQGATSIPVHGITMFERNSDGKFYAVTSVPFERSGNARSVSMKPLVQDACASYASAFQGACSGVLWEIQRTCEAVASDSVETKLTVYGSHAMGASLPTLSDIDAMIEVTSINNAMPPFSSDDSRVRYLGDVASRIKSRYEGAKCRVRTATAAGGSVTLPILTVKLWASAPMVDLVLCQRFSDGRLVDEQSIVASAGGQSTTILFDALSRACPEIQTTDIKRTFAGALRIVKLWAFRRGAYGSSAGYLGGGALAVLLAHTMIQGIRDQALVFPSGESQSQASCRVVKHFFETSSRWSLPLSITLTNDDSANDCPTSNRPMTILSSSATDNLARSTTLPTATAILTELTRSASLLSSTNASVTVRLAGVLESLSLAEFLSSFETVLVIQVTVPEQDESVDFSVANAKAWLCRQLLYLTAKLEHLVDGAENIRPRPTPIRLAQKKFASFIGLQAPLSRDLLDFVDSKLPTMQQDWTSTFSLDSMQESNLPTIELQASHDALHTFRVSAST